MGPSGAGKSTFLNVLAGRAYQYGKVSGAGLGLQFHVDNQLGQSLWLPSFFLEHVRQPAAYLAGSAASLVSSCLTGAPPACPAGAVRVNKRDIDIRRLQAITGFVPQEDSVHEDLTVRENLVSRCCYKHAGRCYPSELVACARGMPYTCSLDVACGAASARLQAMWVLYQSLLSPQC